MSRDASGESVVGCAAPIPGPLLACRSPLGAWRLVGQWQDSQGRHWAWMERASLPATVRLTGSPRSGICAQEGLLARRRGSTPVEKWLTGAVVEAPCRRSRAAGRSVTCTMYTPSCTIIETMQRARDQEQRAGSGGFPVGLPSQQGDLRGGCRN